jgi:hypothetical protein
MIWKYVLEGGTEGWMSPVQLLGSDLVTWNIFRRRMGA